LQNQRTARRAEDARFAREVEMSLRVMVTALLVLTALNVLALSINLAQQSKSAPGAMSYQELMRDPDFIRAVKSVAEGCTVNIDIAKLRC
jgi:hypothetical protein